MLLFSKDFILNGFINYWTPDGHRTDTGRTYGDPRGVIGGVLYKAESIFNVIFEIYAVFTCYLTYYKPSAKKS